jgi:hypothetical protein
MKLHHGMVSEPGSSPDPLKIVRIKLPPAPLASQGFRTGHFILPDPKRIFTDIKRLPRPQDEQLRKKPAFEVVSGALGPKRLVQPVTPLGRVLAHWPWAWLAFAGVVTIAWAIALGWATFAFVQWLVG